MKKTKVLIADDHALIRRGLADLLRFEQDFCVVGEAENGSDAVRLSAELSPDVVIMDLMMPVMGGVDATRRIMLAQPSTKVLLLTSYGNASDIAEAVAAGVSGALTKDTPNDDLPDIVRRIVAGERVISHEIEMSLKDLPPPLTNRQREILGFVAKGCTSTDIAKFLGISADAVNQHLTLACTKLGAANRTEAVAIALNRHLLKK